ncbi:MAG TPA: hypothetical protein VFV34_12535, partial [Blastocatellia bacterium]|nr:hypothetical protein [Blastocatellia bacterium]
MIGREVRGGPTQVDELLVPLLEETSEAEWQNLLVCLVAEHATPVIKKILRYKLLTGGEFDGYSQQDSEDIHSEIILKLVARLLKIRDNPISSFRDYIAVTTYNACHDYFRRKNPERASLKSRLRYLVSHHPDFYIRERGGGDWLCGLAAWSEPDKTSKVGDDQRFRPRTTSLADTLPRIRQLPLAGLAYTIFSWAGRPMDIDELTNAVGKMVGVTSPSAPARHETASSDILDVLPDTQLDIEAELERRL